LTTDRFLTRRELATWAVFYVLVSMLLVVTRFASDDPDSALYANLSAKLAQGPITNWIAPQWWGYWDGTGLFREHPAGVFLLPTALTLAGLPAVQASYVVGIGAGLASLLLIGWLVTRVAAPRDGRAVLVLIQLMPVAFLFRIRANHEYPMLVCLLLVIAGLDGVRRGSWWWTAVIAFALTGALLVKGVFIVLIFLAAGLWVLINPTRAPGSMARPVLATMVSCVAMAAVALAYDAAYLRVTGETFWLPYWRRQLGPLEIATPIDGASTIVNHVLFYLSRLAWHAAPWSLALVAIGWQRRRELSGVVRPGADPVRRGALFALAFTLLAVAILIPSSRFAERYAFSPTYAIGTLGAVAAWRSWPALTRFIERCDRVIPALPAALWCALMLARLIVGPFLPRIT
jgi:4-amino-4-deoxy-L-arabinose transferase-like glycosyltransferase